VLGYAPNRPFRLHTCNATILCCLLEQRCWLILNYTCSLHHVGMSHASPFPPPPPTPPAGGASSADLAGTYSFADLGSGLKAAASAALTDGSSGSPTVAGFIGSSGISGYTASGAAAAGASALSALQARFQMQAGSLGSILGDKAAEVTAMAHSRFESISDFLPSALGGAATSGLLSSFTKGVGGTKK
jgi:hypothetical protein